MPEQQRIYLDNAATSWPKSTRVAEAMCAYMTDCGAAAGRAGYRSAQQAGEIIDEVRATLAHAIGAESRHSISLHSSGTAALNAAIHGLVRPGDHIVTTAAEHNSVLRPLEFLRKHQRIELTIVPCDSNGFVESTTILDAVRPHTRLVAMTHASNVTGVIQPLDEVAAHLRTSSTTVLCDAAQTFGYLPIHAEQLGVDIVAFPGHKGGGGPLGTAALYVAPRLHADIIATIQGGTGFDSDSLEMPTQYPAKLEAGNLNVVGFAGWLAALNESAEGVSGVHSTATFTQLKTIGHTLRTRLSSIEGVQVFGRPDSLPVISLTIDGLTPLDISTILATEYAIETRAGLHCAALIHEHLGTQHHGTLRISPSVSTSAQEIESVIQAIQEIATEVAS